MPRRMFMMIRGLAMVFANFFHLQTPTCMSFDLPQSSARRVTMS
jgi:hypothetical protein